MATHWADSAKWGAAPAAPDWMASAKWADANERAPTVVNEALEVPHLDAQGNAAPIPTAQDVATLDSNQTAANYYAAQQPNGAFGGPSFMAGMASQPQQAFDGTFGQGTAQQFLSGQSASPVAAVPAGPATFSHDWWMQQLGATGGQDYGDGWGYLIDNPITRGMGQGITKVAAGTNELLARGVGLVSPAGQNWIDRNMVDPSLAREDQLAAPQNGGLFGAGLQSLASLGTQIAGASAAGGPAGEGSQAAVGLMDAAKIAARSPALRTAATLGATQAGNEVAQLDASGHPVSNSQLLSMAATYTAANMVPLAGRWGIGKRVLSGALVGEGLNEGMNLQQGRPFGTGAVTAAGMGAALGLLPGHHNPSFGEINAASAGQVLHGERVDFLRDSVARQDFEERMNQAAQQGGGFIHPDTAAQLAQSVADEHGTSIADLLRAPKSPMDAGAVAADAALNEARQATAATTPDIPASPIEATPAPDAPIAPDLSPRAPALPEAPTNVTRDDLIQQWRDARTDGEKQAAAARIAAFDQQAPQAAPEVPASAPVIPDFPNLNPRQREVESRARDQVLADPGAAVRAYQELPGTDGGRIISTDEAREIFPDYNTGPEARSANAVAVHEPSSFVAKAAWRQALAKPRSGEQAYVLFTGGGTGAGKTAGMRRVPGMENLAADADVVYDGNLQSAPSAIKKIDQALATKRKVKIVYTFRDPVQAFVHGALPRAERADYGRTVPIPAHVDTHTGAAEAYLALKKHYAGNPNVDIRAIGNDYDPRAGRGHVGAISDASIETLAGQDRGILASKIRGVLEEEMQHGNVSDRVYHGTLGTTVDHGQPQFDRSEPQGSVGQLRKGIGAEQAPLADRPGDAGSGLRSGNESTAESSVTQTPPEGGVSASGVTHAGAEHAIVELPLADLKLSDDVPQFKSGANDEGVVEPLGGAFDRRGTGPIQVWRRNDGRMEVISGRHRLDLARRSGEQTIPAQVYDESSGFDARQAASLDAELNIRDGQGKVADYVQYFQRPAFEGDQGRQAAESRGLLARATGRRAYTIARSGTPELLAAHRAGQLTDEAAVQIAHAAPGDEALQALGMKQVREGRSITQTVNTMRAVRSMGGEHAKTGDMFGFDDSAIREAEAMAKVAAARQREIGERLSAITGAAKRPELAKKEGIDVRDPEAIQRRIGELRAERDAWDNWATDPDRVSQVRQEAGLPERTSPVLKGLQLPNSVSGDRTGPGLDGLQLPNRIPDESGRQQVLTERDIVSTGPKFSRDTRTSDMFDAPTSAEQLRAAREAKDTERDGLGRRTPTPDFSGTDLGATPHGEAPEQAQIPAPKGSRDTTPTHVPFTTGQVRESAAKAWGNRFIKKMERAGRIEFLTSDELLARRDSSGRPIVNRDDLVGTKGVYHGRDGKAYIVTDHIRDLDQVAGTVLHEAGLHYGYDRLTKPEDRLQLRRKVNRALAAGDPEMVKAWRHAERVGTPAKDLHEEAMAYLVENNPGHGIAQRVVDAFKRGLNRLGVPMDLLASDSDAIRMMARDSLRRVARSDKPARVRVDESGAQDWRASEIGGVPVFSRDASERQPYERVPDSLMGFSRNGPSAEIEPITDAEFQRSAAAEDVRYSRDPVTRENYNDRIDALFGGAHPANRSGVRMLDRADILGLLGHGDKPLTLVESAVNKPMDGTPRGSAPKHPGMTAAQWKKVPEWIERPVAAFRSQSLDHPNRIVLFGPELVDGRPVRIILDPKPNGPVHVTVNAYEEGGSHITPVDKWVQQQGLLYLDQKMSPAFSGQSGLRLPSSVRQLRGYKHRVLTENDLVNYRNIHPYPAQGIRHSRDLPDDKRDLIAQHNTTAAKLVHADRMGGFAVPSLAITRSTHPLEGFGDITLLGDKDLIDPRGAGRSKVFGADAYTPRYPEVQFKADADVASRVAKIIGQRDGEHLTIEFVGNTDNLLHSDAFKRYAEKKLGKDWNYHEARALAGDVLREAGAEEVLFKGYTNAGYRRYLPHTLENVVKALKRNLRGGESWNYGPGSIRAKFTPEFRSIEKIRAEKGRLVSKADFENLRADVENGFFDVQQEFAPYHDAGKDPLFTDTVTQTMQDAASMGIDRALRENGFEDVSPEARAKLAEYLTHLKNLPTEYFEAVLPRAVGIGEFRAAVVPKDTSAATRDLLAHHGLKVHEYDGSVPGDRARAIDAAASAEDVRFSKDLLGDDDSPAAQVRRDAAAARGSVLGKLAADGYGQGAIGWTGNPNEYAGWNQFWKKGFWQNANANLADKMGPMHRVQNAIKETTGNEIDDSADVYRLENLMHGRVADRLDALDHAEVKPLIKSMKQRKVSPNLLMDYLLARHASERNARVASINKEMPDGGSGLTNQEAADILAGKEAGRYSGEKITPENREALEDLAKRVDRIRLKTLDTMETSGQIPPALAAQLRRTYRHYIPLRGKVGDDEAAMPQGKGAGRGLNVKGNPIKRALGRGKGNLPPPQILGEIIGDAQRAIIQAEKARVGRAILKLAAEHPNPDVWQVEPVDLEWKFSEATGEAYLGTRKPGNDQDVLTVMHEGTPYHVRMVDPRIRDAVLNLNAEKSEVLVHWIGKLNRWLSAAFTRYSPAFIPVNAMRDATMGFSGLAAEHGAGVALDAAKWYFPAMRAAFRDARNPRGSALLSDADKKMDDWAREFAERGGKTGITRWERTADTQKRLQREFERGMGLGYNLTNNPRAAARQMLHTLTPIVHAIEHTNDAVENAMRLSAYVALRKRGMSADSAAAYAKDLTVNFNRKGSVGGIMNSLFLFYNASVQGVRRGLQLMKHPKIQGFLGGVMALQASQTAILMSRQNQDGISDWDAIPDWVKQRALIIALPGAGHYFALPMPYEFGFLVYSGGRLTQWAEQKTGKGADPSSHANVINDLGNGLLQAFSPVPIGQGWHGLIPEAIKIPVQVYANKTDFGAMIYNDHPFSKYDMPASASVKPGTAAPYVWLANALNRVGGGDDYHRPQVMQGMLDWSPNQFEFLANTLLGGMSSFGSRSWGTVSKALAGNYKTTKAGETSVDWASLLSDMPVLQRFGWDAHHDKARVQRFYDVKDDLERTSAEITDHLNDGDLAGAQKVVKDAGVFADGWTIKTNQDGTPATKAKYVDGERKRVYQLGVVPGSLAAAYTEAVNGLSYRPQGERYSQKVQPGLQDLGQQMRHAMTLPGVQRDREMKSLRDQQSGLMGAFLQFYENRVDAYRSAESTRD